MLTVHTEYVFTAETAERGNRAVLRAVSPWMPYLPWMIAVGMYAAVIVGLSREWNWSMFAGASIAVPFVVWSTTSSMKRARSKQFAQSPDANKTIRGTITEERIMVQNAHGEHRYEWKALLKIRENPDGFLLFQQPRLAQWLPLSAFGTPADIEQFRAWIQQHGIDYARR